jgi:hypothetical protein
MENLNFNDLLEMTKVSMVSGASLNPFLIMLNIFVATLLGSFIAFVYRKFFVGVLFQRSFAISIILATIVTTLVIMVISGNLVLSLGMVGALSIVRFRAAIKDPLDVVYLFWAIGSGIAVGVSQYSVVLIASVGIAIVLFFARNFATKAKPSLLIITANGNSVNDMEKIFSRINKLSSQRSKSINSNGVEFVYEIDQRVDFDNLRKEVLKADQSAEIRLLNYHGNS